MSIISGPIGAGLSASAGSKAAGAAGEAAQLQYQATQDALKFYEEQMRLSRQDQAPFRAGGLWALEQLIGTEGMQHSQTLPPAPTTIDPRVAGPVNAYNQFQQAKQAGQLTIPKKWPDDPQQKMAWAQQVYKDNKQYYDQMLPTGMKVGDSAQRRRMAIKSVSRRSRRQRSGRTALEIPAAGAAADGGCPDTTVCSTGPAAGRWKYVCSQARNSATGCSRRRRGSTAVYRHARPKHVSGAAGRPWG